MSPGEWTAAIGMVVLLVPAAAAVDHLIDRHEPRPAPRHARGQR